jgi:anthranilate/para-aminobenzoate synthase component I
MGWFAADGSARWNVAIRTLTLREGLAHFHVGAGIVADSVPQSEWQETLAKAAALWTQLRGSPP